VKQLTPRSPRSPRSPSTDQETFEDGPTIGPFYSVAGEQQWEQGEPSSYYIAEENPPNSPQQVTLQVSTSPPDLITPVQQATTPSPFTFPSDQGIQGFMERLRAKNGGDKSKQPVRQDTTGSAKEWLDEMTLEANQAQEIYKEHQQETKCLQDLDQLRLQNLKQKEELERAAEGQQVRNQQQQELQRLKANKAAQLAEMQKLQQEQERLQRKLDAIRNEHQEEPTYNQPEPTRLAAGGNPDDDPHDSDDSDDEGNPGN
jgi:hypothetical protein